MPLTPEDTQAEAQSNETVTQNVAPDSSVLSLMNSRYFKPIGAVLLALGAGYLVRLFRNRKSTSEQQKKG